MIKSVNRFKGDLFLDFEEGRKAAQKLDKIHLKFCFALHISARLR